MTYRSPISYGLNDRYDVDRRRRPAFGSKVVLSLEEDFEVLLLLFVLVIFHFHIVMYM